VGKLRPERDIKSFQDEFACLTGVKMGKAPYAVVKWFQFIQEIINAKGRQ
jgi:hypothetical protein